MIKRSINTVYWLVTCAFTVGLAGFFSALMSAWHWLAAVVVGVGVLFTMVLNIHGEADSLEKNHKKAEAVAGAGLVVFLGVIFTVGLLPALIAMLVIAQLALNIRADNNNRIYSALVIGFVCLMCGATEAKTGSYLIYMAIYGALAVVVLRHIFQREFLKADTMVDASESSRLTPKKSFLMSLAHHGKLVTVFLGFAFFVYLLIPRFPAGNIGARVSNSGHFYNNGDWEQKEKNTPIDNAEQTNANNTLRNDASNPPLDDVNNPLLNNDANADDTPLQSPLNSPTNHPANNSASNGGSNAREKVEHHYDYHGFNKSFAVDNPDPSHSRSSNALILRVKSDVPLYLKARVFDSFDGLRWSQSSAPLNFHRLERGNYSVDKASLPANARFKQLEKYYQVFVETNMSDNIPVAEQLIALTFPAVTVAQDGFGQWRAGSILQQDTVYGAEVQFNMFKNRQFSAITAHSVLVTAATSAAQKMLIEHAEKERLVRKQTLDNYLTVPAQIEPRVYQLASEKTQEITGEFPEFNKAVALETFLRTEYAYDFASIFNSQGVTPIEKFLFETKKGHCEYFASALVMMLRTLDIPARVVTGFLAHNQNPLTDYYEVRALDGHAWVEAYVDDLGWMVLEPTAYYPAPEVEEEQAHVTVKKIQDYIKNLERIDEVTGQSDWSLATMLRSFWYAITLIFTVALAALKLIVIQLWWLWLIVALLVGAGFWVWTYYAGAIKNRYLLQRVQKAPAMSIADSLKFIHQALANVGRALPAGLTIEQFNDCVASSHLGAEQQTQVIALFNDHYYASKDLLPQEQVILAQLLRELLLSVLKRNL